MPFENQLTLSPTLRIVQDTELEVAVLRHPTHPLVAARSDGETSQLVRIFSSCIYVESARRLSGLWHPSIAKDLRAGQSALTEPPPLFFQGPDTALIHASRERLLDAETCLHNILRLPQVRTILVTLSGLQANCKSFVPFHSQN